MGGHPTFHRSKFLRALIACAASAIGFADANAQITASWLNPVSGEWNTASNWSISPQYPYANYWAVIDATGSPYTITANGTFTPGLNAATLLARLTLNSPDATLRIHGSTLYMSHAGTIDLTAGTLLLDNAILLSATLNIGAGGHFQLVPNGGAETLQNVAISSTAPVELSSFYVYERLALLNTELRLQGTATIGSATALNGTGTIVFDREIGNSIEIRSGVDARLDIGSGITIRTGGGNGEIVGKFVNHGTIASSSPGKVLALRGEYTNLGTLIASNSTLQIGGNVSTAGLGTIINSNGTVVFSGTLDNTGTTLLLDAGAWRLETNSSSALIRGGTISVAAGASFSTGKNARLSGVTLDTDLTLDNDLRIENGLTLPAGRRLALGGGASVVRLYFQGAPGTEVLLDGAGEVVFDSDKLLHIAGPTDVNTVLKIGPQMTVRTASGSGTVGQNFDIGLRDSTLINQGTLSAQTAGRTLTIAGNWKNEGTLLASQGTLVLSGTFTASGIGTVVRTGGEIDLTGHLDLEGSTLTLNETTGPWTIKDRGTVRNGTLTTAPGIELVSRGGQFDGVLLDTDLIVRNSQYTTLLTNSTFSGHRLHLITDPTSSHGANFSYSDTASVSSIEVIFDGDRSYFQLFSGADFDAASRARTGVGGGTISGTGTNYGTMSAETPGATLNVLTMTNAGTYLASNGATLTVYRGANHGVISADNASVLMSGTWTNLGTIQVTSGTLLLGDNRNVRWTQKGTIAVHDSTLVLSDLFTLADALSIERTGESPVLIRGHMSLDNGVLAPDSTTGIWTLQGGSLYNGTLATGTGGGAVIIENDGSATFSNVTLDTDFEIPADTMLRASNQLTIHNHELRMRDASRLESGAGSFSSYWSLSGSGTITFDGDHAAIGATSSGTLSLGARVRTGSSGGSIGSSKMYTANVSTISAETPGKSITIVGTFSNSGTLEVRNGGIIDLSGATLTNMTSGALSSGSWSVFGASTINFGAGSILHNFAVITLDGPESTFPIDAMVRNARLFTITSGRNFTTVGSFTNTGTITAGPGSTFTFGPNSTNTGTLVIAGGTFDATGLMNLADGVLTGGRYRFIDDGHLLFGEPLHTNAAHIQIDSLSANLSSLSQLTRTNGIFLLNGSSSFATGGDLANSGTIQTVLTSRFTVNGSFVNRGAATVGGTSIFHVFGDLANEVGTGPNSGRLVIGPGGVLLVEGDLINTGRIIMSGFGVFNYDGVPFDVLDSIAAQVRSGYNGGSWNGLGITRSVSDLLPNRALVFGDNAVLGLTHFGGQEVDATSILMRVGFLGDANLSGETDIADFDWFLQGFLAQDLPYWYYGDFDYDGVVSLLDFEQYLIGYFYRGGTNPPLIEAINNASLSPADRQAMFTLIETIPEPAALGLLCLFAAASGRRRVSRR